MGQRRIRQFLLTGLTRPYNGELIEEQPGSADTVTITSIRSQPIMTTSKRPDGQRSCVYFGPSVFQGGMQSLISLVQTRRPIEVDGAEAPNSDPCLDPGSSVLRERVEASVTG